MATSSVAMVTLPLMKTHACFVATLVEGQRVVNIIGRDNVGQMVHGVELNSSVQVDKIWARGTKAMARGTKAIAVGYFKAIIRNRTKNKSSQIYK